MNKISAIYKIQSQINPKRIYIGSAVNLNHRWLCHLSNLRNNKHHSIKLQRHFNKYGESDLQFSILLGCEKEDLLKTEQYFIDSYNPYFNVCKTAGSQLGMKRSDSYKIKCRERMIGKVSKTKGRHFNSPSNETRLKMSLSHKERYKEFPMTTKTKHKIGLGNKDKTLSEDHKKRLSNIKLVNPVNNIKIEQYLNNKLINTFISIGEACRVTKLSYTTIKNSINNKTTKWKTKKNQWIWKVQTK
jgi:group I intron endonuclease